MKPHNNWNNDRSFERLVTRRKQVFLLTDCKTLQAEELQNQMYKNYDIGQARDVVKAIKKKLGCKHPNTQVHAVMSFGVEFPQRAQVVQSNHLSSRPSRIGLVMYQTGSRPQLDMKRLISKESLRWSLNLELMHLHEL